MRRMLFGAAMAVLLAGATPALASHPGGTPQSNDPVDGPLATSQHKQHQTDDGHLPASSSRVKLVGKLDNLTEVPGGIADVGHHDGYAYLNAFSPECTSRGGSGTGVHIVDVSRPKRPRKVGFLPAEQNSYVGEGISIIDYGKRDILVHNNETCDGDQPVVSGFSVWDVTDPRAPVSLGQYGDSTPAVAKQTFHTTHSVQAFSWRGRAYAVAQDNQDLKDVDIFDITPAVKGEGPAVLVAERGLEDWPGAQTTYANGDSVFHHDMQQKVIRGQNMLAVSYWDAGQVLLNIDDPANPVYVGDSNYLTPDPEFPAFGQPEGNSHQSYFDQDGDWLISTDEDFSPTRTFFQITDGPHAGQYGGGEFSWAKPIPEAGASSNGGTVFGGSGCPSDQNGNGAPDNGEVPSSASTGADTVVFSRGACFFSDKVRAGEDAGYSFVLIGQSHGGSRNGMLRDGFTCGSQGSPTQGTAHAVCIGHRAMHLLFDDEPGYGPPEGYAAGGDLPPIGTRGANVSAQPRFDGWGYVHLHDARNPALPIEDTYAVDEGTDPAYRSGFGDLTVHEVKTDPRRGKDLAYLSYYSAGLRVLSFGPGGMKEIGHYIAEGGNDFWGVFPVCSGECEPDEDDDDADADERPLLLMSDRDSGLWILRYTGRE